jgi:hypothetical protein
MKPSLNEILRATLETLNIDSEDWEKNIRSRKGYIIRAKELFCTLAAEEGHSYVKIGLFLGAGHSTAIHHAKTFKAYCELYPTYYDLIESANKRIPRPLPKEHVTRAWLARCKSGALVISSSRLVEAAGYWISEGSRPYYPASAFPQVTYGRGPVKVLVTVSLDEDENL